MAKRKSKIDERGTVKAMSFRLGARTRYELGVIADARGCTLSEVMRTEVSRAFDDVYRKRAN